MHAVREENAFYSLQKIFSGKSHLRPGDRLERTRQSGLAIFCRQEVVSGITIGTHSIPTQRECQNFSTKRDC